jgi:hypothetical protein
VPNEFAVVYEKLLLLRRGDEFLEARIFAERIKHWIEPE